MLLCIYHGAFLIVQHTLKIASHMNKCPCWCVCRCSLRDVDGVTSLESLEELYLAFNDISDISQISLLEKLEILDLEG